MGGRGAVSFGGGDAFTCALHTPARSQGGLTLGRFLAVGGWSTSTRRRIHMRTTYTLSVNLGGDGGRNAKMQTRKDAEVLDLAAGSPWRVGWTGLTCADECEPLKG